MDRAIAAGCTGPADRIGHPTGRPTGPIKLFRSRLVDHAVSITGGEAKT
jgi:hypothetical protein